MNHLGKKNTIAVLCLLAALALVSGLLTGCGGSSATGDAGTSSGGSTGESSGEGSGKTPEEVEKIYLLTPDTTTPAWPSYYEPTEVAAVKKQFPNAEVTTLIGDDDQEKQLGQVEAAISAGAEGVILTPVDPAQAGASLVKLAAAKIPTIGYLHDPLGGPVDGYVGVNFEAVGKYFGERLEEDLPELSKNGPAKLALIYGDPTFQVYKDWLAGMEPILNPLVESGKVKVVCKADSKAWEPSVAQTATEQCLTKTGDDVSAVLAMNDSTSDGISAALKAQNLEGKVKIYGGHDASLTGVQRVLTGEQVATFDFDAAKAGSVAAKFLAAAIEGKSVESTGLVNNKFENEYVEGGVPMYRAPEQAVTPETVQKLVVDTGIASKQEICTGPAAKSEFCKGS